MSNDITESAETPEPTPAPTAEESPKPPQPVAEEGEGLHRVPTTCEIVIARTGYPMLRVDGIVKAMKPEEKKAVDANSDSLRARETDPENLAACDVACRKAIADAEERYAEANKAAFDERQKETQSE